MYQQTSRQLSSLAFKCYRETDKNFPKGKMICILLLASRRENNAVCIVSHVSHKQRTDRWGGVGSGACASLASFFWKKKLKGKRNFCAPGQSRQQLCSCGYCRQAPWAEEGGRLHCSHTLVQTCPKATAARIDCCGRGCCRWRHRKWSCCDPILIRPGIDSSVPERTFIQNHPRMVVMCRILHWEMRRKKIGLIFPRVRFFSKIPNIVANCNTWL